MDRRKFLAGCTLAGALPLAASFAAQPEDGYPSQPVKIVVPFSAGGSADSTTRVLAAKLAQRLKEPFVVENRTGASGTIAGIAIAKSPPDGYNLMTLASPGLLAQHMIRGTQYDVINGFVPVASFYDLPLFLVVNPKVLPDVNTLADLIAVAQKKPRDLAYTSSGIGSFGHLSMELLKATAKFDMQHVPYRGGSAALVDVISGQIPVMMADAVVARPQIEAGNLRAVAVASPQRVDFFPNVPTISEQGFSGFSAVSWGGILAPANTSRTLVAKLEREIKQIMAEPDVQESFAKMGVVADFKNSADTTLRMRTDFDKWGDVIRKNGISGD
ncbi:tripartite tricarboxylate transporter substrate binding protein [Achromobacter sp. K91]|uniref:Bug family tripartite tricarboxylate transporter substrate binding protein n=1 Tax=Achromobacter sp. K91 TaxID=2292262 RepID=UPI000E66D6FC|nr:tripartite tricarboxylate transporter substrate binding protein [Achromobacter sp. K91]RIJ03241.1 tripartite tricarboxylate transporter substrate binding protein [Achromobacter sp. K91]